MSPVNSYFNHTNPINPDKDLYEDLIIESIQINGMDLYYLPRGIIEEDNILNEEIESTFPEAYMIEAYLLDYEGDTGNSDLLSKFGLEVKDELTFIISRRRFRELNQNNANDIDQDRPYEGDLLYDSISKKLFEIKFAEDEKPFYQLANIPTYELRCELFVYEGQEIDTGIDEIDKIEETYAPAKYYNVSQTSVEDFVIGEDVTITTSDGIIVYGEIYGFEGNQMKLGGFTYSYGEVGEIISSSTIVGDQSGATAIVVDEVDNPDTDRAFEDNDEFNFNLDNIIDDTFSNPFGDL